MSNIPIDVLPMWQAIDEIARQVPDEDWERVPRDLARNVDRYLYGAPTVDDVETAK